MSEKEQNASVQSLKTTLAKQNELQSTLAGKYDAQSAFLGGQDVEYVEAGNNERKFVGNVQHFLGELSDDQKNYETLTSGNKDLRDQLNRTNLELEQLLDKTEWTPEDLKKHAPAEMAVNEISAKNFTKSTGILADASKQYVNKMDGAAAAYSQAWDRTKHTEATEDLYRGINTVLDLVTGIGIGSNAVTQFAAKEFKEVSKTFDRFTNAYELRGGQVGDLLQASMNAGYQIKQFSSTTAGGMAGEIENNTENAGAHIVKLSDRFNDWITEYNRDKRTDPNPFVPI